ncbi:MAG: hypothetical protein KBD94_03665 [Pyrinomonadaceae bacterium]|nr:hypothetical protein [Pyrinomonadaceae bacterium]
MIGPEELVRFTATIGKGEVSALLMRPGGATHLVVLGHGAGADMRSSAMQNIAEHLAERDIATFRYNFPFKEYGRGGVDSPKTATATVRAAVAEARRARTVADAACRWALIQKKFALVIRMNDGKKPLRIMTILLPIRR